MICDDLNVSRETEERLALYLELLKRWNPKINLVAKSTISDAWSRHLADSAQLMGAVQEPISHWADLGSGGGFPGLVIAIMAAETGNPDRVTLVESDQRKCTFLRAVARECGIQVDIRTQRIENCEPLHADVVSARALAELSELLGYVSRHLGSSGTALLHKGRGWKNEVEKARRAWSFHVESLTSKTESDSVILRIKDITRV